MAFVVNENRPMMLKDFLRDDCMHPCKSTAIILSKPNKPSAVLLRSRSKKAAATTISAINKVINVVKFFHLASVKSPPVNISRKLAKRSCKGKNDISGNGVSEVKVKVKDILRWKSFRDIAEERSTLVDFPASPDRSTATTTSSCSKRSSWCESDFTAEELPLWGGENEGICGKKCFLGRNTPNLRNPKMEWLFEESEQQSPVSVFDDSPFRQVEEPIYAYHPNVEGMSLLTSIQEVDDMSKCERRVQFGGEVVNIEEKAKTMLRQLEAEDGKNRDDEGILLEFFMHEVSINGKLNDEKFECEILKTAKSWSNGEVEEWEDRRDGFVKDMEKGVCWNKFKEEEEISNEIGVMVLDDLVHQLLAEFL